jgi:hypothetical protein
MEYWTGAGLGSVDEVYEEDAYRHVIAPETLMSIYDRFRLARDTPFIVAPPCGFAPSLRRAEKNLFISLPRANLCRASGASAFTRDSLSKLPDAFSKGTRRSQRKKEFYRRERREKAFTAKGAKGRNGRRDFYRRERRERRGVVKWTHKRSCFSLDFRQNLSYDFRVAGALSADSMFFENLSC